MGQQLQVLFRAPHEVEGDQHSSRMENRVRRYQPFRLVGHDDGGAVAGTKLGVLKRARQRQCHLLEIGVSEASAFAVSIRFDQASFVRPAIQGVAKSLAETGVLIEIEHQVLFHHRDTEAQRKLGLIHSIPGYAKRRDAFFNLDLVPLCEFYSLDWIRSASVLKSETPCNS